jgi:ribosome assembly protein 4
MSTKRKRETKEEVGEKYTDDLKNVMIQLINTDGAIAGGKEEMDISIDTTPDQLKLLVNTLLKNDEARPYIFFLNDQEIKVSLRDSIIQQKTSPESVLAIRYEPQAIWRVRAVTRCSATIQGHTEAVLHVHFSADGKRLASGSGDCTVRLWDVLTQTPQHTLKGHKTWVLAVAWSPNCKWIASGDKDGVIIIWDPETGKKKKNY